MNIIIDDQGSLIGVTLHGEFLQASQDFLVGPIEHGHTRPIDDFRDRFEASIVIDECGQSPPEALCITAQGRERGTRSALLTNSAIRHWLVFRLSRQTFRTY